MKRHDQWIMALSVCFLMLSVPQALADAAKKKALTAPPAKQTTQDAPVPQAPQAKPATTPTASETKPAPILPPTTGVVVVGDLAVDHPRIVYKGDNIDIYLSIKNNSKDDEKLMGGASPWKADSVVLVTHDKDGKEIEAPLSETLPGEKNTRFAADGKWLRLKNVKTEPKESDVIPLTLFFRRSPNATVNLALDVDKAEERVETQPGAQGAPAVPGTKNSSWLDWFKK